MDTQIDGQSDKRMDRHAKLLKMHRVVKSLAQIVEARAARALNK